MNTLPKDTIINIVSFLDYYSKISLYLISSDYNFIPDYIYTLSSKFNKFNNIGIKKLTNLRKLDLTNNNSILDDGIKKLINLTDLDLSYNKSISNSGIEKLTNLTNLGLNYTLGISNTGITNLTNLNTLSLHGNNITIDGIRSLTNITELDLCNNIKIKLRDIVDLFKYVLFPVIGKIPSSNIIATIRYTHTVVVVTESGIQFINTHLPNIHNVGDNRLICSAKLVG